MKILLLWNYWIRKFPAHLLTMSLNCYRTFPLFVLDFKGWAWTGSQIKQAQTFLKLSSGLWWFMNGHISRQFPPNFQMSGRVRFPVHLGFVACRRFILYTIEYGYSFYTLLNISPQNAVWGASSLGDHKLNTLKSNLYITWRSCRVASGRSSLWIWCLYFILGPFWTS